MNDDTLLKMSEEEWWIYKAEFCQSLYRKGLECEEWTEERGKWWLQSIIYFVEEFVKPEFPIPDFHQDWYKWAVTERAYLNLSPRDHAKTTVHSIIRVVWEICVNRNITFFIALATTDVAKLILSQIKSQLVQNPRIKAGFGIFNPMDLSPDQRTVEQDWSQTSITVNRDDYSLKDPTVVVAGALTNVLSRRVHRLYVDDLLTDKIAYSDAESERLSRWYFNDVQPVLRREGQEIITGTRYKRGDFYDTIITLSNEADGIYKIFIGDAIIDEINEKTLWEERWPYKALMRQRAKMGLVRFNRNYRNRITSDQDSSFPMIWFTGGVDTQTGIYYKGCYDERAILGNYDRNQLRMISVGVDPAIGQSKNAKFFALVVLGLDHMNRIVIADMVRGQFSFPAQKRLVIEINDIYRPRSIAVENNSYQIALVQGLQEERATLPVIGFHSSVAGKHKPDVGVPAMDIFFESGRFKIPRGSLESRRLTDLLIDELHYWGRNDTSDMAMALWFAFERMKPVLKSIGMLPKKDDLLFGDRLRYEREKVLGLAGQPVPRLALEMIRSKARSAPLDHLSPLRKVRS